MSDNPPPGCNVNDIPGNSAEDAAWDDLFDWLLSTGFSPIEIRGAVLKELK